MLTRGVINDLATRHHDDLEVFAQLFHRWNQKINLSAARSLEEIREHIRDSLYVVPFLSEAKRVLDVGSGGGFPVVMAAICLPTVEFVSLEPVHKKHAFLRTAARELGLNLDARADRIEAHDVHDYDVAMSRATFDLAEWFRIGLAHVRPGGLVLGFEALERNDLINITRHPYQLAANKTRAILTSQRST